MPPSDYRIGAGGRNRRAAAQPDPIAISALDRYSAFSLVLN
jgi:hypothetical protein